MFIYTTNSDGDLFENGQVEVRIRCDTDEELQRVLELLTREEAA